MINDTEATPSSTFQASPFLLCCEEQNSCPCGRPGHVGGVHGGRLCVCSSSRHSTEHMPMPMKPRLQQCHRQEEQDQGSQARHTAAE